MKKLIPISRFDKTKDNSDSLKEKKRKKGADKVNLELYARAENVWMSLSKLRKRRERNINYCFVDQWSDYVRDEKGNLVKESTRVAKRTGGVALQNNHLIKIIHSLSGLYSKQSTEPVCFARQPNCDEKADMMTNALQANWQTNQMPDLLVSEMCEMLYGGMSVVIEEWATINGVEDAYTFAVEPSHFFFDSTGVDPLHRDVELIGHFEDYSLGALAARFAKSKYDFHQLEHIYSSWIKRKESEHPGLEQTDKLKDASWDTTEPGMCRVYHVWTKEHKMRYRCKDILDIDNPLYKIDPEQISIIEQENAIRLEQAASQGIDPSDVPLIEYEPVFDVFWHYQALAPGGLVLEEYDNPYEHGSHPYTYKLFE